MEAYRYHPGVKEIVKEIVPIPEPAEGEVVLKVSAAGLCHSDLHLLAGEFSATHTNKVTMSHEIAGHVHSIGASVPSSISIGQHYAVVGLAPCTKCSNCLIGRDNICTTPRQLMGIGRDGGFAKYVAVPITALVLIPSNISPSTAAVCTDALLTPYHATKTVGGLQAGENVVIIGLGGLGLNAVAICKLLGANVYATDLKPEACEIAKALGAIEALPPVELIAFLSSPSAPKIDLVVDFVGHSTTFDTAQDIVGVGGRIVSVGLASHTVSFHTLKGLGKEVKIMMCFWGTINELKEVIKLVGEGKLNPLVKSHPLSELPHWIEEFRAGRVSARLAFIPDTN